MFDVAELAGTVPYPLSETPAGLRYAQVEPGLREAARIARVDFVPVALAFVDLDPTWDVFAAEIQVSVLDGFRWRGLDCLAVRASVEAWLGEGGFRVGKVVAAGSLEEAVLRACGFDVHGAYEPESGVFVAIDDVG